MEKIRLKLKAYDHRVLDKSVTAITEAVKRSGAELIGPIPMPTKSRSRHPTPIPVPDPRHRYSKRTIASSAVRSAH